MLKQQKRVCRFKTDSLVRKVFDAELNYRSDLKLAKIC